MHMSWSLSPSSHEQPPPPQEHWQKGPFSGGHGKDFEGVLPSARRCPPCSRVGVRSSAVQGTKVTQQTGSIDRLVFDEFRPPTAIPDRLVGCGPPYPSASPLALRAHATSMVISSVPL